MYKNDARCCLVDHIFGKFVNILTIDFNCKERLDCITVGSVKEMSKNS